MGTLELGAQQAINKCIRVNKGEEVVLVTDRGTAEVADALEKVLSGLACKIHRFVMEDFGERPEDGSNPLPFPRQIAQAYETATVSIYAAAGRKGELKSFRVPMLNLVDSNPKVRHGHMPNVNRLIMETGMSTDYDVVQQLSAKVHGIVKTARQIRVTSPAGTDFLARFNPAWRWLISDGQITAEQWSNLPDGEVFTCAETATGRAVVDGCLGDYFGREGTCETWPVIVDFKDGLVTSVRCEKRPEIQAELEKYVKQDANASRIGEFAIGTNVGLDRIIGVLLQDEKFPGVHIAIGHGYPEKTGSPWSSDAHLDMVLRNVTIEVDGRTIMKAGGFTIL
ncbi:MAG: aminopeptidase [Candidatus Riflebacteria bacterium]|nr:aminopeptidase [Candidatus Riflebacteria bacterium]